jgi:tol-pal system protein YbgF
VARPVPGGPLGAQDDANAPLDLTGNRQAAIAAPPAQAGSNSSLGAMPATTPKDEFELAVFSLERGQYDAAEASLATFLQRYPKDPLAGEAVYYLGESFFKRNRHRDAAEQYLKISTDHPKTAHAPDAMLRLGQSLEKLGAKEQACAFYAEVPRKYPQANAIKTSAQREYTRAKCS